MSEKKPTIIFDFDGTIANTLMSMLAIVNMYSEKFGHKKIGVEEVQELREKGSRQILKHLGISFIKLPRLVKKIREELNYQIPFLDTSVDIRDTILKLKEQGFSIGILTSNSKENVKQFLEKNHLDHFDYVYSGKSVFGKAGLLKHIIKHHDLQRDRLLYVADEVRDINAAKKSHVKIACVTWGFNTERILKTRNPDYVVKTPDELFELVCKQFATKS